MGETEGNYTHMCIVQGKQADMQEAGVPHGVAASPDRALWEGATATKVSWVRLRIR